MQKWLDFIATNSVEVVTIIFYKKEVTKRWFVTKTELGALLRFIQRGLDIYDRKNRQKPTKKHSTSFSYPVESECRPTQVNPICLPYVILEN